MRMFVWNPFHTSGKTCRNACGLKNASRKRCIRLPARYFKTCSLAKSMLNHFFCHFEIEPLVVRVLIARSTKGFSLLPFVMTAPYFSFVMIWPATGPYALGFVFFCEA